MSISEEEFYIDRLGELLLFFSKCKHVCRIEKDEAHLDDGTRIPISRLKEILKGFKPVMAKEEYLGFLEKYDRDNLK